jgi:hypothetical protein
MQHDGPLVDELAAEIQAYIDAHPDAADTIEGIVNIWIVQQRFLRGIHAARRAIGKLIDEGRLEEIRLPDGRTIFRARTPPG